MHYPTKKAGAYVCFSLSLPFVLCSCAPSKTAIPNFNPSVRAVPKKSERNKTLLKEIQGAGTRKLATLRCSPVQIERDETQQRRVALTFDRDWNASATFDIIKALRRRTLKATFFITGHFCHTFPSQCKALKDSGMEVGNHSYSHPRFQNISNFQIRMQLANCEEAISQRFGYATKPLFRFPYGESDSRSCKAVAAAGFQPIYWSLDSLDGFGAEKSEEFVFRRVIGRVKPGDIVLMHVSSAGTAAALPRILDELKRKGLRQVCVSDILIERLPEKLNSIAVEDEKR